MPKSYWQEMSGFEKPLTPIPREPVRTKNKIREQTLEIAINQPIEQEAASEDGIADVPNEEDR
jgi:hypothetical protein